MASGTERDGTNGGMKQIDEEEAKRDGELGAG
jgi:hypothetical protein